ncbi:MAG: hypothetical protein KJ574_04830, partial [Nanoarchaeota archaeon]|nr:hypothetical protein [Nanoarchaeota archaeon]
MLKRFFRNKNAFGLKMVAFVVVALLIFVVVSVIVFPNLATEVKGIVGLIKECKRPAYNMDKYVSDINQALDILRDIEVYSSTGERIDIEIDADE